MPKRVATPKNAAENKKLKTTISSAASAPSKGTDIALCDTVSLSGSSVCARDFTPMLPHEINEKIIELGLPSDYVVRLCDLCGGTSIHENIFAGHTDCVKWEPLLPWGSGSKHMPKGSICRMLISLALLNLFPIGQSLACADCGSNGTVAHCRKCGSRICQNCIHESNHFAWQNCDPYCTPCQAWLMQLTVENSSEEETDEASSLQLPLAATFTEASSSAAGSEINSISTCVATSSGMAVSVAVISMSVGSQLGHSVDFSTL
jgi:hypothetical protein